VILTALNNYFAIRVRGIQRQIVTNKEPLDFNKYLVIRRPKGGQNAALIYNKIFDVFKNNEAEFDMLFDIRYLDYEKLLKEKHEYCKSLVKRHAALFDMLYITSRMPYCNFNIDRVHDPCVALPHLGGIRKAVRFLTIKAMLERNDGKYRQAIGTFAEILRISDSACNDGYQESFEAAIYQNTRILKLIDSMIERDNLKQLDYKRILNMLAQEEQTNRKLYLETLYGMRCHYIALFENHFFKGWYVLVYTAGHGPVGITDALLSRFVGSNIFRPFIRMDYFYTLQLESKFIDLVKLNGTDWSSNKQDEFFSKYAETSPFNGRVGTFYTRKYVIRDLRSISANEMKYIAYLQSLKTKCLSNMEK